MKPVVEITVSPAGDIAIDAIGFRGADCQKATEYLEQALGVPQTRKYKQEFHQVATKAKTTQTVG